MTEDEARLFLGLQEGDDLEDAYEDALFEIRKFLLAKPVLLKTLQSRQAKLKQLQQAFGILGGTEPELPVVSSIAFHPSENILEHHSRYFEAKNELKRRLSAASGAEDMHRIIDELIELERSFVKPFSLITDWTSEEVLVSREADSMEIIRELRRLQEEGVETLEALNKNKDRLSIALLRELKRLSLHQNYLYE